MPHSDADDPTVPTGRAGVDPLLAYPTESTGSTGQIERPGDQTPWWFVPGLCAVAVFFIGLLATINQDRTSDRLAAEQDAASASSASVVAADADGTDGAGREPGAADTTQAASATDVDVPVTLDPRLEDLPAAGTLLFDGVASPIVARCEVQLPFDPSDTDYQVSSYFFFGPGRERMLIDRIFDGESEQAQLLDDSAFVELDDIGDAGAFAATFDDVDGNRFEVVVNPATDSAEQCGDRLVTNEPGQFTETHTRIILDVCIDRTSGTSTPIVGLTSEGARFEILQPGGELGEIVFVDRDESTMRSAAPAFIIRNGDNTSASGVVSEGANDLDITIDIGNDVTEADARTCVPSDRL
ncbi:MAG: hypothetical protein ABJH68_16850 [Ilumatobacter sp.]|uniref:hypothetical protein n=2 Tax=Ilumatobacter sp. TaxID=1967498 RepID=UPI00329989A2